MEGFPLDGEGLLETVTVTKKEFCANGTECTGKPEATTKQWEVKMNTYECGYNFPLIAISGKTGTTVSANVSLGKPCC